MWKKGLIAAGLTGVLLCSAGCGTAANSQRTLASMNSEVVSPGAAYDSAARDESFSAEEKAALMDSGEIYSETSTASLMASVEARKIILSASFRIETAEYENTLALVEAEIERSGSYIQYSDSSGSPEGGNVHTSMTIRVPSEKYNDFKAFIPTAGNVLYSSESGQDVTSEYFDADTRVKVLKAQEERVLELLDKAETVEDMLQIEEQLARIRTQIEQLTGELKRYDDLITYATVELSISQTDFTIAGPENLFTRMSKAMHDSLQSMAALGQNALIGLVWIAPYLVIAVLVALLILLIVSLQKKRRNSKAEQQSRPADEKKKE